MMFAKLHMVLVLGVAVCIAPIFLLRRDPSEPHYELVTERQMARSPAYGAFAPNPNFLDGITFRSPPKWTIARGTETLPYKPDQKGETKELERAGKELKNPLSFSAHTKKQGANLYADYCKCCHGPTGTGDGPVSAHGFPQPLSFLTPNIPFQGMEMKDGEMFHILTFGKGHMPSHAVQLTPTERWAVILHVRVLQNKYTEFPKISVEETKLAYLANCMACHGPDGAGSVMRATKLPNIPDFSSLAWQLAKTNLEITNRIEYGDEPLMPAFRYRLARDQILGLSIYIRSFAVKEGGPASKPAPLPSTAGLEPVQIFRAYCLACHNVDGKGAIVRPGMPDIPDFTLPNWPSKADAELSKAILSGGKFMPPMKDKLAPADADRMVKFIRTAFKDGKTIALESPDVKKSNDKIPPEILPPEKQPIAKEKITPLPTSPELETRLRGAGVLFRQYCIVCHGPDGAGMPAMRAALPPLPDFTRPAFRDQHSDTQLLISILDGKGTLMPANRGRLNEGQARDLVAYVRAFAPPGTTIGGGTPSEFQQQFEQLQRQWEALEREIRALKQPSGK
jgi:mono/diheme cytochrome c family protein